MEKRQHFSLYSAFKTEMVLQQKIKCCTKILLKHVNSVQRFTFENKTRRHSENKIPYYVS